MKFKSATVKTPELYFDTYKEIIKSIIINNENFNLNTVISLVKYHEKVSSRAMRKEQLKNILSSLNVELNDLAYIYFYLQSGDFSENMYLFINKDNLLFNWLFLSDLNSQLVDYIFEFKNLKTYNLIHRILSADIAPGLHYIANWEFENGINLLEWFKAFLCYGSEKSLETYINEKKAFKDYPFFKEKFLSYNISKPEVLAMLPDAIKSKLPAIKVSLISENPSEKLGAVISDEKQEISTQAPSVFSGFSIIDSLLNIDPSSTKTNDLTNLTKKNLALLSTPRKFSFKEKNDGPKTGRKSRTHPGSSKKSSEPIIGSSLEEGQSSSKRKKQKASTQDAQVFLDYSKKDLEPNINPALESPQVLEREYAPISGDCFDFMSNKKVTIFNISSPENKCLSQHTVELMTTNKSQLEIDCVDGLLDLYSKSELNTELSIGENNKGSERHISISEATGEVPKNLMSTEVIPPHNVIMIPVVDLSSKSELETDLSLAEIIPKLFLQNYGACTSGSGLFRSGVTGRQGELEDRFAKINISEKFFYQFREGLAKNEEMYEERRLRVANTKLAVTLQTPLLLIFEHEHFKSATVKTPELYLETYKEIINSKIVNNKNFNLATVVSIVTPRSGSYKSRQGKLKAILSSENLEPYDLVYVYFYLQSGNFFENMRIFIADNNPIFNWLFLSDLNSQLVDYVFELKNKESFNLVHRIINVSIISGLRYICNWEFENGVELLAWFKAYLYHIDKQSPETYIKKTAFTARSFLKKKFASCDINQSKVLDMLPNKVNQEIQVRGMTKSVDLSTMQKSGLSFFSGGKSSKSYHFFNVDKGGQTNLTPSKETQPENGLITSSFVDSSSKSEINTELVLGENNVRSEEYIPFSEANEEAPISLMVSKETPLQEGSMTSLVDLSSKSELNTGLALNDNQDFEQYISFSEVNEETLRSLISTEETQPKDSCAAPFLGLDFENQSEVSLFFKNKNLEEEKTFVNVDPENSYRN